MRAARRTSTAAASAPAADIALADPAVGGRTRAPCPKCGGTLVVGQPACARCGYDPRDVPLEPSKAEAMLGDFDPDATPSEQRERKKPKPPPPKPKEPTCTECHYVLTGVPARPEGGRVCPECGHLNRVITRSETLEEDSREVTRWSYLKPALMIAGGLPVYALCLMLQGWWQGGWQGALTGPMRAAGSRGWTLALQSLGLGLGLYVWSVGVAFVMTAVLGVVWTGVSTTFRIMALSIAGLLAVAFACGSVLFLIPLPLPWWAIYAFCALGYSWYLGELLDLDLHEAFVVTFLTAAGIWASGVGLALML
ncbi:MAG: hypothetical protein HBSAPP03_26080 [Phycisphaerae bacterium]|nr:MAG: hypothetical protein HBSAPP03_26080 [Phycisphaerae bacterium]